MSNTNTVPSAKQYLKDKGLSEVISESDLIEFTKLHLEVMRDGICKEVYLNDIERSDIIEYANTYIKNNKL